MDFAIIENNIVTNIVYGTEVPDAVCINDLPVAIGDTYDGKYFYHNGQRVYSVAELYFKAIKDMHEIFGIPYIEEDD